jgi:DNA-binding GntR family transcriptional regulator
VTVTEALFRLEQDGLVDSEPMYGSRVRSLSSEMVRNETALREALECQGARLYATNASPQQKDELMQLAERVDRAMSNSCNEFSSERPDEHLSLHLKIARYSGFAILEDQLQRVWFRRLMQLNNVNARLNPGPSDWHVRLIEVLNSGDRDAAEHKMREHVQFHAEELYRLAAEASQVFDSGKSSGSVS